MAELAAAVAAGKGLLTGVHTLVAQQVMPGAEALPAVGAAEGPLACVASLVHHQSCLALEVLAVLRGCGRVLLHQTTGPQGVEEGVS